MKRFHIILICLLFLIPFTGCKKESFDPSEKTQDEFIGTWKGTISTFKNNELQVEYSTVVIYPETGTNMLSGVILMKETHIFREFQFVDGTIYFNVINNDPENPFCQTWSLGGYAVFTSESEIEIHITGNECGDLGNEFVDWSGTLNSTPPSADTIRYYNFAKQGNAWVYDTYMKNGDSCLVQKQMDQPASGYLFNGSILQTCGWTGPNKPFSWNVTPGAFTIVTDTTLTAKPVIFPLNAKPGVVYSKFINQDTITVTLTDTNLLTNTPAGTFTCLRFRYTQPVYSSGIKTTITAYIWLNNLNGVIRQEVMNPVDTTDIQLQVLSSKNF